MSSRWHEIQHDVTSFLEYGSEVYGRRWIQMREMAWEQRVRRQSRYGVRKFISWTSSTSTYSPSLAWPHVVVLVNTVVLSFVYFPYKLRRKRESHKFTRGRWSRVQSVTHKANRLSNRRFLAVMGCGTYCIVRNHIVQMRNTHVTVERRAVFDFGYIAGPATAAPCLWSHWSQQRLTKELNNEASILHYRLTS